MPRYARLVRPGTACHITARGNYRQPIFFSAEDQLLYLSLLARYSQHFKLALVGWSLMTNHVHLLAIPERADSMAQTIKAPTVSTRSRSTANINAPAAIFGRTAIALARSKAVSSGQLSDISNSIRSAPA